MTLVVNLCLQNSAKSLVILEILIKYGVVVNSTATNQTNNIFEVTIMSNITVNEINPSFICEVDNNEIEVVYGGGRGSFGPTGTYGYVPDPSTFHADIPLGGIHSVQDQYDTFVSNNDITFTGTFLGLGAFFGENIVLPKSHKHK
jgi:hypothetical protein